MTTPRRIVIEGAAITSLADAWEALALLLELPAHFGRNLDALYDCLTADVPGPIAIDWRDAAASRAAIGPAFDRLCETIADAAAARPDLTASFRD